MKTTKKMLTALWLCQQLLPVYTAAAVEQTSTATSSSLAEEAVQELPLSVADQSSQADSVSALDEETEVSDNPPTSGNEVDEKESTTSDGTPALAATSNDEPTELKGAINEPPSYSNDVQLAEPAVDFSDRPVAKVTKTQTGERFVASLGETARKIGQQYDLYASVMLAQACLESGFGASPLAQAPHYNLFGIKGTFQGQSVCMETWEELNGQSIETSADFRSYPSYQESFADYAVTITQGIDGDTHFYEGAQKTHAGDYKQATAFLTGRYATDSLYADKLNAIIEAYQLTQYDVPEKEEPEVQQLETTIQLPVTDDVAISDFEQKHVEGISGMIIPLVFDTAIHAAGEGVIRDIGYKPAVGNYIVVQHHANVYSYYMHISQAEMNVGDAVNSNSLIGKTGRLPDTNQAGLFFALSRSCWTDFVDPRRYVDALIADSSIEKERQISELSFGLPVSSYTITSTFGMRSGLSDQAPASHKGVDLAGHLNDPVFASLRGTVIDAGFEAAGAGNYVVLQHPNGYYTYYFHMNALLVQLGDIVESGQSVGLMGSTGDSTGVHLHFAVSTELWDGYLDPAEYLALDKGS